MQVLLGLSEPLRSPGGGADSLYPLPTLACPGPFQGGDPQDRKNGQAPVSRERRVSEDKGLSPGRGQLSSGGANTSLHGHRPEQQCAQTGHRSTAEGLGVQQASGR